MIEPHSPVRHAYFSPMDLAPVTMAGLMTGLCCVGWYQLRPSVVRMSAVAVVVGIGVLFHEAIFLIGVCALGCAAPEDTSDDWRWLPLTCGTVCLLAVRLWVIETPTGFSGYDELLRGFQQKSLLQYGLASLLVFGPLIAVPVFFWRRSVRFLIERPVFLVYLSLSALLAWSVGGDAERLLVFASPVAYILTAQGIMWARLEPKTGVLVGLFLLQAASSRIFAQIGGPIDPPEVGSEVWERLGWAGAKWALSYDNMWSLTSAPLMTYVYAIWYGLIGVGIIVFLRAHAGAGPTTQSPDEQAVFHS